MYTLKNPSPDPDKTMEFVRYGIDKSVATIFKEERISFEQVFYNLFFDAAFINPKSFFSFQSR